MDLTKTSCTLSSSHYIAKNYNNDIVTGFPARLHSEHIVIERKYFTCPSRESNPGSLIYRQTLYHVAVTAGFYSDVV